MRGTSCWKHGVTPRSPAVSRVSLVPDFLGSKSEWIGNDTDNTSVLQPYKAAVPCVWEVGGVRAEEDLLGNIHV